jgi:Transposase DDE domain group 1
MKSGECQRVVTAPPTDRAQPGLSSPLLLDGDCRLAGPKTLRFRLWQVAGRIVRHARRVIVRIDRTWPWATDLVTAFARLRALPARC